MSEARIAATSAGRDRTLSALAVALALAYAGAQFPGPFAVLDNLSNFPAHFAAAFLGCAALFAWRRRALPALACAALAALALARVVPWYFGAAKFTATLLSAVSGIPGGIFAPSLAVGAGIGDNIAALLTSMLAARRPKRQHA